MSTEDLKRVVRQHIDLTWNKGRLALAEQLQSKDFLYKSSFLGQTLDSAGYAGMVQEIREAMPEWWRNASPKATRCSPGAP